MSPIFSSLAKNVGIDIGSMMTSVFTDNRGIVLTEPSVVATDAKQESIIAVGNEAELLLHTSQDIIEKLTPFHNGVIADYRVTRTMIQHFVKKSIGKSMIRSRVMMAVPCSITDVEKRAMTDAILQLGCREAYLIHGPILAALSQNMPIFDPVGSFIADIGCGTTDVVAVSMGGIVAERSARLGGNSMNRAITKYLREELNMMITEKTVEDIKLTLGTTFMPHDDENIEYIFKGRDRSNGLMKSVSIKKSDVYNILMEPVNNIIDVLRSILEQMPPEICADILNSGLLLTGGVAKMEGFAQKISTDLGVPVKTISEPELAVVKGFERAFKERDRMGRLFVSFRNRKGRT